MVEVDRAPNLPTGYSAGGGLLSGLEVQDFAVFGAERRGRRWCRLPTER